jgi:hypothetical protein
MTMFKMSSSQVAKIVQSRDEWSKGDEVGYGEGAAWAMELSYLEGEDEVDDNLACGTGSGKSFLAYRTWF